MYNKSVEDTAENNKMFDLPWADVTEEMITARAKELSEKLGGWIWHQKWDGKTVVPHVTLDKELPQVVKNWAKN
jgi:hypothetical protein